MMKKYFIVSVIDDLNFPLREATRKQIWWMALAQKKEFVVEILLLSNEEKVEEREGITITYLNKRNVKNLKIQGEIIHFINNNITPGVYTIIGSKGKKILTLTDGNILGESKQLMRKIIAKTLPFIFDKIQVYSNYQKDMLGYSKAEKVMPILPKLDLSKKQPKAENPTIFYMGHLSTFKGVDTIIEAFKVVVKELPNLQLVIANNMVRGDKVILDSVNKIKEEYPENVIIKGVIDPVVELSKAWVYLYPFKEALGTMAYALSLYESLESGTPFIASNVGANSEFFDSKYLIEPGNHVQMANKIKMFINEGYPK